MSYSINITAEGVAWYGAIVATMSAGISIFNAWKDRARIKITYQKGMRIHNAQPPWSEDKDYFIVHVTNTGRRPVAIGNVGVKYIFGETFILADSLNNQDLRILTEEKPHAMITTDQSEFDFSKLHCIMVYDKAGREYKKYFSKVPTFKKWIKSLQNMLGKKV